MNGRWSVRGLVLLALLAGFLAVWLSPHRADAAAAAAAAPRYRPASCTSEWMTPGSTNAARCVRHGWVIRSFAVIGPRRWVRFDAMRGCSTEDDPGTCVWWAGDRGNHVGRSFVHLARHNRTIYVRGFRPCRCDDPDTEAGYYGSGS